MRRMLALADAVGLFLAMGLSMLLTGDRGDDLAMIGSVLLVTPAWILICKLYGLYDRETKRIGHSGVDDVPHLFHALMISLLLIWGYSKLMPVDQLVLTELALFGVGALFLIIGLRSVVRAAVQRLAGPERMLLVGTEPVATALVSRIVQHPEYGVSPVGLLSDEGEEMPDEGGTPHAGARAQARLPRIGRPEELERIAAEISPDRIVICRSDFHAAQVMEMVDVCRRAGLRLSILPDQLESLGPSVEIDAIEGVVLLGLNQPALSRTSKMVKRGFDLLGAGLALLLVSPVLAVVAFLTKLDSPGPVIFTQLRVGRGGKSFRVLKFRTMCNDAEAQRPALMEQSRDPRWLHLENDPRITRVGSFLRRTSIDELPQLVNVVRGEMSLVGPRPLPEEEDAQVDGWGRSRLDLTPGITGLWQVLGRTSIPFDEMVKLDYIYVTNWSLWMDTKLLLQTFPTVATRRGAN